MLKMIVLSEGQALIFFALLSCLDNQLQASTFLFFLPLAIKLPAFATRAPGHGVYHRGSRANSNAES